MNETTVFTPPHPLNTAVLFLVFNRLDTTKQVFEAIRQAKPPRLYIASDGARTNKEGETEKVQVVRDYIMQNIDWDCEIKTLFREQNLGCKYAVSGAITWFFENEEQGIILEDDCLPSQSFFWYCEELLNFYAMDTRIAQINGHQTNKYDFSKYSYLFSYYGHVWGWATWRRAWSNFSLDIVTYENIWEHDNLLTIFKNKAGLSFWKNEYSKYKDNKVNGWVVSWQFYMWMNDFKCIDPSINLVENIGFGENATNMKNEESYSGEIKNEMSFPLVQPKVFLNSKVKKIYSIKNIISRFFK